MTDTALLAVLLAAIGGVLAGRAWASARHRGASDRAGVRTSPHYMQGLHALGEGRLDRAITELEKVVREDPDAVEVHHILANLLRETGQVERAIQVHQRVLGRSDLSRAERAHTLAALGTDFRKAGFVDRATAAFEQVLAIDANHIHALEGLQRLHEDQRLWARAYEIHTRLSRLRRTDDSRVLGHLQAEIGREAARVGDRETAESAFRTALSLDQRVFPAHLGLADLSAERDPHHAAQILEAAIQQMPERAYLAFERLARAYAAAGEPSRFVALCEQVIRKDPRDWRARVALAGHLRGESRLDEAYGLLRRALECNPHVLVVHLECWRTLSALGMPAEEVKQQIAVSEGGVFYRDPHLCRTCRYRSDDLLWRCPHCHEWDTFVEERLDTGLGR